MMVYLVRSLDADIVSYLGDVVAVFDSMAKAQEYIDEHRPPEDEPFGDNHGYDIDPWEIQ